MCARSSLGRRARSLSLAGTSLNWARHYRDARLSPIENAPMSLSTTTRVSTYPCSPPMLRRDPGCLRIFGASRDRCKALATG